MLVAYPDGKAQSGSKSEGPRLWADAPLLTHVGSCPALAPIFTSIFTAIFTSIFNSILPTSIFVFTSILPSPQCSLRGWGGGRVMFWPGTVRVVEPRLLKSAPDESGITLQG